MESLLLARLPTLRIKVFPNRLLGLAEWGLFGDQTLRAAMGGLEGLAGRTHRKFFRNTSPWPWVL